MLFLLIILCFRKGVGSAVHEWKGLDLVGEKENYTDKGPEIIDS